MIYGIPVLRRYCCKHAYCMLEDQFFFSCFLLSPWRVFACNNLHLSRPPQNDLLRDTRVFSSPFSASIFIIIYFYTAFIKNLLNIDFALVSPPPAIWPQPGGGSRGGNCFVRRSNKNYKTFMCTCKGIIHDNDNNI